MSPPSRFPFIIAVLTLAASTSVPSPTQASGVVQAAEVKVSNSHLVTQCLNGATVTDDKRTWKVTAPTTFVFTMHNEPRSGIENRDPGLAVISFTPETGHHYEIEVRAEALAFSRRVWARTEWKPVVRDRTTDRIVSSDPKWIETGCR